MKAKTFLSFVFATLVVAMFNAGCASTLREAAIGVVDYYSAQAADKLAEENKFPWGQMILWGLGLTATTGGTILSAPAAAKRASKLLNARKKK